MIGQATLAAVALSMSLALPMSVAAQEAQAPAATPQATTEAPAPATGTAPAATETATTPPAATDPAATQAPAAPAATTVPPATGQAAPADQAVTPATPAPAATDAPAVAPAVTPAPAEAPATAATPEAIPVEPVVETPAPSVLQDPMGAIQNLLAQPERRADLPHDLSPWGMFIAADIVVKAVMLGLVFASLVTWTVWLAKSLELAGAKARVRRTLRDIRQSRTLKEAIDRAGGRGGPAALMLRAAQQEAAMSDAALDHSGGDGLKDRVSSALNRIEAAAGRRITKGTGVLATIGSTAPFVGLFGTVWGIMNSFIGISEAQTTNLAVVAPGIAEALLATALGLVAAIPAVMIYNMFARSIAGYRHALGDAGAGVERLISRDLDFRNVPDIPVHSRHVAGLASRPAEAAE